MRNILAVIALISLSTAAHSTVLLPGSNKPSSIDNNKPIDLSKAPGRLSQESFWSIEELGKGEWKITYKKFENSRCSGALKCQAEGTTAVCKIERNLLSPCLMAFGMSTYIGRMKADKIEKAVLK